MTAEQKTKRGRSSTEKSVESGDYDTGILPVDEVKIRFVEKVQNGDFTFPQDMVRGLAIALGVEDELDDEFFGQEQESHTAGLTPATGSGGAPYDPEAASAETEKHAKSKDASPALKQAVGVK